MTRDEAAIRKCCEEVDHGVTFESRKFGAERACFWGNVAPDGKVGQDGTEVIPDAVRDKAVAALGAMRE
jgi:hypothetical protein